MEEKENESQIDKESCRLCLGDKSDLYIFDSKEHLIDKIQECCDYIVEEDEIFPSKICHSCHNQLNMIINFKSQCRRNEMILQKSRSKMKPPKSKSKIEIDITKIQYEDSMNFFSREECEFLNDDNILDKTNEINNAEDLDCLNFLIENFPEKNDKIKKTKIRKTITKHNSKNPKKHRVKNVCEMCQKPFCHSVDLKRHMFSEHNKKVTCMHCGKQVAHEMSLSSHIHRFHSKKIYKAICDYCGKKFIDKYDCTIHIARMHTQTTIVECDMCGKKFANKETLKRHIVIVHDRAETQKCHLCGKTLKTSSGLQTHLRTHTGEKPHKCEICERSFNDKHTLINHNRTHTGETPYKCPLCNQSTNQLSNLKSHFKYNHKGIKFYDVYQKKQGRRPIKL